MLRFKIVLIVVLGNAVHNREHILLIDRKCRIISH